MLFRKSGKKIIIQDYESIKAEIDVLYGRSESGNGEIVEKVEKVEKIETIQNPDRIRTLEKKADEKADEKAEKKTGKKTLLYLTSESILFEYGEMALKKMKNSLTIFKDHRESINLVWYPDLISQKVREAFDPELLKAYEQMKLEFAKEGWGKLIEMTQEEDPDHMIHDVDAVYGDASYLMMLAIEAGKPVMLQNIELIGS